MSFATFFECYFTFIVGITVLSLPDIPKENIFVGTRLVQGYNYS
jgi:hypothetical protein